MAHVQPAYYVRSSDCQVRDGHVGLLSAYRNLLLPQRRIMMRLKLTLATLATVATLSPLGAIAAQAPAITPLTAPTAAQLRNQYMADLDTVHAKLTALAEAIPADKFSWRPAPGVRSVSEVLMHMTTEWDFYCPQSVGRTPPADYGAPKDKFPAMERITAKDAVLSQMKTSWAYCSAQLKAADPATLTEKYKPWGMTLGDAAFAMTGDGHEHLGQLIAYARSVGVKPPWSK